MNRKSTDALAGVTATEARIAFLDLPLYEDAAQAETLAESLAGGLAEFRERLEAGNLGSDARYDLSLDLFDIAEQLRAFATAMSMSATR